MEEPRFKSSAYRLRSAAMGGHNGDAHAAPCIRWAGDAKARHILAYWGNKIKKAAPKWDGFFRRLLIYTALRQLVFDLNATVQDTSSLSSVRSDRVRLAVAFSLDLICGNTGVNQVGFHGVSAVFRKLQVVSFRTLSRSVSFQAYVSARFSQFC